MKIIQSILVIMLITGIHPVVHAKDKLRVLDRGMDGNKRIYLITCPDGTYSSVVQEFERREAIDTSRQESGIRILDTGSMKPPKSVRVCIFPHGGKDKCRTRWNIDAAARESCQR